MEKVVETVVMTIACHATLVSSLIKPTPILPMHADHVVLGAKNANLLLTVTSALILISSLTMNAINIHNIALYSVMMKSIKSVKSAIQAIIYTLQLM